jgi:hypothetical protein
MAGAAPTISEPMMPASSASVRIAAAWASNENSLSAHGAARRRVGGRFSGSVRSIWSSL